ETIELLTTRPDAVVLVGRVRERGRTSGAEVAAQGAAVFQLRDGKVDPGSPGPACLAGIVARMSGRPIATLAALACAASPAGACGTAASVHHAPARPDPILVRSAPGATTAATAPPSGPPAPRPSPAVPQPPIHRWPIPFGAARKREMAAYSLRHYGEHTYLLRAPKVIVEHYTETATAQQAYNTFAPDVPDSEFGQLPNTCAHFLVEPSGK